MTAKSAKAKTLVHRLARGEVEVINPKLRDAAKLIEEFQANALREAAKELKNRPGSQFGTRPKGVRKTPGSGRTLGTPNKETMTAREAYRLAFEGMGAVPALMAWGMANPDEFYKLHSKLMPLEIKIGGSEDGVPINININKDDESL